MAGRALWCTDDDVEGRRQLYEAQLDVGRRTARGRAEEQRCSRPILHRRSQRAWTGYRLHCITRQFIVMNDIDRSRQGENEKRVLLLYLCTYHREREREICSAFDASGPKKIEKAACSECCLPLVPSPLLHHLHLSLSLSPSATRLGAGPARV